MLIHVEQGAGYLVLGLLTPQSDGLDIRFRSLDPMRVR